jgi:hypothetical protein
MLEVQIQFAITFELFELAFWNSKLASALRRSKEWTKVWKLVILVDSNGVPLGTIGIVTHSNLLKSEGWFGVVAESSASNHLFFANNFLTNWAIFLRLKISVRIKMICKLGLT